MSRRRAWQRQAGLLPVGLVIFGMALGLRLHYQDASQASFPRFRVRSDAFKYYAGARSLYLHGVYSTAQFPWPPTGPRPTAEVPPGYSLFLLPFLAATFDDRSSFAEAVGTAQALLGALTAVLALLLARQLLPTSWSVLVGLLTAASPHLIAVDGFLLTESLFTVVLLAGVLAFITSWRRRSLGWTMTAGLLFGAAVLIRPIAAYLSPFVAVSYLLRPAQWAPSPAATWRLQVPLFFLSVFLAIAPYPIRNAIQAEHLPANESRAWKSFLHGAYIDMIYRDPSRRGYMAYEDPHYPRMLEDREFAWQELRRRFDQNPWGYVRWYLGGKILCSWDWDVYTGEKDVYIYPMKRRGFHEDPILNGVHRPMKAAHWPLVTLAFLSPVSLLLAHRWGLSVARTVVLLPLMGILLYHAAFLTLAKPIPRYTIPLRPYAYVLAVANLWVVTESVRFGRSRRKTGKK